jgi:drug/metabolite transporter (DMT)-like permease
MDDVRTDALTLAAAASLAWGLADLLAGVWARRLPVRFVLAQSKAAGFLAAAVAVAVSGTPFPADARLWWAALAGLAGVPAMGFLYLAIRRGPLAVVAPVAAGAALVPLLWDLVRGARPGTVAVLGALAALVGITLASLGGRTGRSGARRAAPYAVLAALGLGLYFVLLHEASGADPLWATAVARVTGAVAAVLVLLVPDRSAVVRPPAAVDPGPGPRVGLAVLAGISCIGVLDALADRAFVGAAVLGGLGPASVLSSLYPAVTVVLGVLLLRERVRRLQAVGVVAALAGAALVGVG